MWKNHRLNTSLPIDKDQSCVYNSQIYFTIQVSSKLKNVHKDPKKMTQNQPSSPVIVLHSDGDTPVSEDGGAFKPSYPSVFGCLRTR